MQHRDGETVVEVPTSRVLLAAVFPCAAACAWGLTRGWAHVGRAEIEAIALSATQALAILSLPVSMLAIVSVRSRSTQLTARASSDAALIVSRPKLIGATTESFRRSQVDSLRIAERRDYRGRRQFSLELSADDGFDRVVLKHFSPAELDVAARALRARMLGEITSAAAASNALAAQAPAQNGHQGARASKAMHLADGASPDRDGETDAQADDSADATAQAA